MPNDDGVLVLRSSDGLLPKASLVLDASGDGEADETAYELTWLLPLNGRYLTQRDALLALADCHPSQRASALDGYEAAVELDGAVDALALDLRPPFLPEKGLFGSQWGLTVASDRYGVVRRVPQRLPTRLVATGLSSCCSSQESSTSLLYSASAADISSDVAVPSNRSAARI